MPSEQSPTPDRSVRFFGGPLDGRVQELTEAEPVPGTVVRHIHLHGGPKIETLYELGLTEHGWEYRLRAHETEPERDGLR
ncbi:hypothetical protein [Amycolatopsis jiangsuensis]|uniref:Uncharacterized protein n=1 Tax=Amycolatopsis jiangsuensis TaxID=1181879 RepID=A0A840IX81_9PSEU|nr:hypothetical protein [Amycolatopsis jiangsuensis]MBB4685907.1 hypothetical protein [Amycolatopsis jiangsuensis]